jgi:predicted transcriptional regulator
MQTQDDLVRPLTIRVKSKLLTDLSDLARPAKRSRNSMIEWILEQYVKRHNRSKGNE